MEWTPVNMYYVYTGKSTAEFNVVKDLNPPRLLISYYYFRRKSMKSFIETLGYTPEIMLDSGAWSAFSCGKDIRITDYMKYIAENTDYIRYYISLDVIGDSSATYSNYIHIKKEGFNPIPVFHFQDDFSLLNQYVDMGVTYIALGGTVPVKSKNKVARWINSILFEYPGLHFHVLGSSSSRIVDNCNIYSCDSTTWFMSAINGHVPHMPGFSREDKIKRATYLMQGSLLE